MNTELLTGTVRLNGDGWYIEISPNATKDGIVVRSAGTVVGSGRLLVMPTQGNVVEITTDIAHEAAVCREAVRLAEIDNVNANGPLGRLLGRAGRRP